MEFVWTALRLYVHEKTGDVMIVEGRRESLLCRRKARRTFYIIIIPPTDASSDYQCQ
ncbi:hypothetical protein B0O99DRAFT_634399 [Bisporella sp. PMI_857]|nr:hypothetical protein B0O99DRAFT_634399 [Bisporella sp. PMI_857]